MRFHFDPNNINKFKQQQQEKQQKQAKIELQEQQQVKQVLQMDLINENQNVGNQIQNQEPQIVQEQQKQLQDEFKQIYEPKEGWEKLPDYPFILREIAIPECNQNELYLMIYQTYLNEEIQKFKEHFSQFQELIFYSDKMQQMMNKFIDKERKMKQQFCQTNQQDLPYMIKKLEYQQQINQYEKSIDKFIKAQQKIKLVLQSDISQHMSIQMVNHVQYDQSFNTELFHQKISEFLEKNENMKEQLTERTTQHFIKLSNDSRKIQKENQEIEKQIQELEQKLGKNKNQFQVLNCFI